MVPTSILFSSEQDINMLRAGKYFPPSRRVLSWSPATASPGHQEKPLLVGGVSITLSYPKTPYKTLFTKNHTTGTSNEGSMFSVLQSFSLRRESPEATIINPPTISSSAISASLMAVLDTFATR